MARANSIAVTGGTGAEDFYHGYKGGASTFLSGRYAGGGVLSIDVGVGGGQTPGGYGGGKCWWELHTHTFVITHEITCRILRGQFCPSAFAYSTNL